MDNYLVLSVKRYDFKSSDGQRIIGMQAYYLDDELKSNGQAKGQEVIKISGNIDLYDKFTTVPGLYKLGLRTRPGSGGKATVRLAGVEYIGPVYLGPKDLM